MSSQPEPDFTMAELLEEILGASMNNVDLGEKLTTREIKNLLGLGSMKTTRNRIRPLVEAEVLIATRVTRPNIAGFNSTVPAYAVNPAATWEQVEDTLTR